VSHGEHVEQGASCSPWPSLIRQEVGVAREYEQWDDERELSVAKVMFVGELE